MYTRWLASFCLVVSACVVAVFVPSAAHAVAYSSSGARCTIVGTRGPDVLTGTPGRDVICGLGGNDRIDGRGGADIIDAGAGRDVVYGDAGVDRIYGGAGNDSLYGQGGADVLSGGLGGDRVQGGTGTDRIAGGAGNDALLGQGGADVLSGGSGADGLQGGIGNDRVYGDAGTDVASGGTGNDLVSGGIGNDRLAGASGADKVLGDAGGDVLSGGDGADVLSGAAGDDELSGGSGGDNVDGGVGFNICDEPAAANDHQVRCVVDQAKPVVRGVTSTPATVDVSAAAQSVRLEAHVTDDTGVKSVQIGNVASLVSGTPRDGVWATTIRVPRYIAPGPREVDVDVRDRVGRYANTTIANAYTVVDTVSDQEMPVLQSMSLSTNAVDVRSASKPITVSIRVTDDLAGATDVYLCGAHAFPTGAPTFRQAGGCDSMIQSSGTPTDSTWTATYVVPKGAPSGTWNFEVWISDASGNFANDFWLGPDELADPTRAEDPRDRAIPGGAGVFTVTGVPQDFNAPVLTSLTLNPSPVDTSTGAVRVTATIAGTDLEGITGADLYISGYAGYPNNTDWTDLVDITWLQSFQLVSGTPQNGVWRATFVVPGGTPDGSYFIQAVLEDSSHFESWVSSDSGWTTDNHVLTPELAPAGDHFVVANS